MHARLILRSKLQIEWLAINFRKAIVEGHQVSLIQDLDFAKVQRANRFNEIYTESKQSILRSQIIRKLIPYLFDSIDFQYSFNTNQYQFCLEYNNTIRCNSTHKLKQ
ncbi:hypothetical protein FGO68_gene13471 [Halteria grandinella]|uniref:Uncharacterized protein n=1 Tax=Halteria grandinella TaxID=5974 RepID=A0A8J8NEA3_HALGN|nr:hypothetical protein FGO68_gene13471 [Halteria grandinella]